MVLHRFAISHDVAPIRHESRLKSLYEFKFVLKGQELLTHRVHEEMLCFSNQEGVLEMDF